MRALVVLGLVVACGGRPQQLPPPTNYSPPVVAPAVPATPPAPDPPKVKTPTSRRSYASKLMLVDLPLLLTFLPVLGLLGGLVIGPGVGDGCRDLCGVVGALIGAGVGTVIAAVHDWTKAYVED